MTSNERAGLFLKRRLNYTTDDKEEFSQYVSSGKKRVKKSVFKRKKGIKKCVFINTYTGVTVY